MGTAADKSQSILSADRAPHGSEWRWVGVFAGVVMLLTSVPYFIGFQRALSWEGTDGWRFSGFVFGVEDGNSYIAKMRRGMEGEWLFRSPYSGMEQKGVMAFFPYYLLGKLVGGKATHEQLVVLFHWFRIGSGILCILATYRLLCEYLTKVSWRRLALVLISVGGGLGWLSLALPHFHVLPLEFYSPEAFGFLSLYALPHLNFARAFLLLTVVEYLQLWRERRGWERGVNCVRMGLYWLLAGLFQPIHAGIAAFLFSVHLFVVAVSRFLGWIKEVSRQRFITTLLSFLPAAAPALLLLVYTGVCFLTDPYLKIWAMQNRLPTAPLSAYGLSYGWLLPFAVGEIRRLREGAQAKELLLPIWLGVGFALILVPIPIQRRLVEGVWVILVLLSLKFLESLPWFVDQPKRFRGLIGLVLICSLPSSLLLVWGGVQSASVIRSPLFLPEHAAKGFEYLDSLERARDAIVLASYSTSNALPAYAFVRVIIGHGPESPFVERVSAQVAQFFEEETTDAFRKALIREHQIQYVIWGENERKLGEWRPSTANYLIPIYQDQALSIFEVDREKLAH
ncbi:MAG: hypothetical protein RML93_06910 [Anaerolineales bacterium]|nr:hypothetical protein [Anaerolineales bacterium]MDW8447002.1 hypothetical protein [Anaerolineales bacterium]